LHNVSGYDPVSVDGGCGNEYVGLICWFYEQNNGSHPSNEV